MRNTRWIFVFGVAALCSCVSHGVAQSNFAADGVKRASFDLNCAPEKITYTVLKDNAEGLIGGSRMDLRGSTVGVQACGQRATYVYAGGAWVLNSEARDRTQAEHY